MKYKGKKIDKPNEAFVVIPRNDGDLVFKAQAVLDFQMFDDICPRPTPQMKTLRGGQPMPDLEEKSYVDALNEYSERRVDFMILKSLEATDDLEWETVNMEDPTTWKNYDKELSDACLTEREIDRVISIVFEANGLSEAMIQEARDRFLQEQAQAERAQEENSLTVEPMTSASGEPANASE